MASPEKYQALIHDMNAVHAARKDLARSVRDSGLDVEVRSRLLANLMAMDALFADFINDIQAVLTEELAKP